MQKILLLRFSSIGDIVLTTPILRCLKTQLKDVEIHYLTKQSFIGILESNPYIDKVISYDDKKQSLKEMVKVLQAENYAIVIDLHKNFRSWYICQKLGIKPLSFNKLNWEKWLITRLKINKLPDVHIVDRYFQGLAALRIKNDGKGLDYFIPILDYVYPQNYDFRLKKGQFIVFGIGATYFTKRLPAHKIKKICSLLPHEMIVLLGGETDIEAAKIIESAGNHVVNLCGKLNLNQSASMVEQARLVVTHDTGLMHIAAALKRPIISIWGNTIPQFGMYPYLPMDAPKHLIVENKNLTCRPCSKLGSDDCPRGHFLCMEELEEGEIVKLMDN